MRKYFFVLLIAMTFAAVSNSQVSNYTFAASSGTYTPLVAPTNIFTGTWDDNTPVSVPIGFTFNFNGANYTSVFVNANGSISFGATAAGANYTPISGTTAYAGAIAAWGRDIQAQPAAPAGSVDYLSSGGVFTVQWTNARRYDAAVVQTERMNFQIRLIQATNQVVIVYGSWTDAILLGPSGDNATVGGQVGLRGATNADFKNLSVLAAGDWASPTAGAVNTASCYYNSVTPATKPATGQTYTFTPPPPCVAPGTQPTGLSLTPISTFQINGSFTATAADGYLTVRYPAGSATTNPVTGTTYTAGTALGLGTVVSASATTTFNATGLTPGTTYDFYVYAYNNLVCSVAPAYNTTSPLTGSQTTTAAGNITSLGTGLWSVPGTWSTGIVPTATDNVTIADGHTVTIDIAAVAYSVTVGQGSSGILQYEQTTARTLTVGNNVTIAAGGTFQSNAAGTVTTHTLSLAGNLVNNGTLDFSTNANTAAAGITFTGASNNSFGGTGAVTDLRTLIINKGTSNANILELNPSNFTVQGTTTDGTPMAFLTLTNGTLKVSGTFTLTGRVFTAAAYTIGTTAGFWLNNPNFTVAAQVGNAVNNGLFRITQGVFNQGTLASHSFRGGTGALFTIEGGIINCAGQFSPQNAVIYNQSGGTLNVGIVGNSQSNFGTFELFSSTATFTMSGGVINIVQASTGATQIDFQNLAVTTVTGGMLNIGTAATVTKFTYNIRGNIPNITIDNTTNNKSATATSSSLQTFMRGTTLINTGTTLTINGQVFIILGPTFTNNGTLTGTTASTRFYFLGGLGATTYTGSGVVTAPLTSFEVDNIAGVTMTPVNQVVTARFNNFSGGLTGSNKLTIGNGAATTAVVQLGVAGVTQVVSGFDVPPVFNPGSGGVILLYAPELTGRITGNEMPPSRTLTTLGITNTNPITIAGGDVIVNGAGAGALALGAARVITGTNTLYFNSAAGTVTRSTGYVDGNFRKSYTAAGSKTFEVGTANGYSPVDINVTAGTFPTDITAKAVQGTHPNLNAASSLQRYWTLTGSGVTADFTFNYLAADVSGTEANYDVVRIASGVVTGFPASTVNTGTHVATLTGVTSFSDWSLSELCTGAVGGTATGTTAFCGSGTPTITATGYSPSGTGTSYQWEFSNDNFVSDVHDFVGQTDPATLTTGVVSSTTYYRLRVSCSVGPVIDYSNIVTVTINLVPTAFTVTGGGTYCGGAGVPVGLSDSESGVDYQLFLGAAPVGAPLPGSGSAISFGNQTAVGTYTVVATNTSTTCTNNMTGSVNVSTATAPVVTAPTVTQPTIVTPTGTIVVNATGGPTLEYSVTGVGGPYQLSNTFTGLTPGASYNIAVRLQNTTGCETLYSGNPIIMNTTSGRVTDVLVGASPFQDSMWTINLADYTIIRRIGPTLPGFTITGINALATHPLTGEHFAILKLSGVSGRVLAKINVQTGVCTQVGNMGDNFSTLAFRPNGELYSVTGNGSNPLPAETMYSINTTTGAPTFYRTLGNGADGEVIAYNPDDNFFYHWSGNGTVVWEKFANDTDPIQGLTTPVSGEVFGALYAGGGEFWVSNISSTIRLWNVTTQTASAVLMNTPDDLRGLVRESCSSSLAASGSTAICSGGNVVLSVIGGVADYQWYRDGVLIGGETNPTLTVTTAGFYNAIYTDGCGVTDSVTLGISVGLNPTPDALATPSAQTICSAGTITTIAIAGTVPGTTYNWTRDNTGTVTGIAASGSGDISGALTNTTNAPVIVTFTITPTANGCTGTPVTATVTVNPTPTVDAVPNQVVCNNAFTAAVNFTSPVSGTTFNWTNTNTSIGLGASGTGNIASFLATNAGTAPITGTITVTPVFTSTGGPVSVPFNYTGTPQTWTVPAGVTSIRLQAAGAQGGSVSTACTATGGLGASMAGDFAVTPGEVLTIIVGQQGNTNGSDAGGGGGTYIVRAGNVPLLVAGGGGGASNNIGSCGSNLNGINASITTSGTASGDGLIAGGTAGNGGGASGGSGGGGGGFLTDGIAGTGLANNNGKSYLNGSAGGTGNNNDAGGYGGGGAGWFTGGNGGGGGGYSGGGTSGAQPFTGGGGGGSYNDGTNQVNTAAAQTGNGFAMITTFNAPITCTGTPTSFTYTVNPTPVITPVANQTVCNGAGIPPVNFVVSTTGGINSIAWTNSNPAIGIPASGTGNIFGFTATNATNAPISGTITVTPSFSNGSVTCSGTSITYTVTVNPTATVTAVANQTVCNGANTTAVNFTSPTTGGTIVYNWTNNTPSIGLAASGSGNIASFVGTNATNAPVTATITVTPTYTNGVSCVGTASTFTITVNPTATVTAVANQTLCNGASTAAVTFTSPTTGGTIVYNWTNNTPSIGLAASGSGNIASFTAVNAGTAPVVATITVTPTYTNGVSCVGTPRTFTITVNPTPNAIATPASQTICSGATITPIVLTSGVSGTTYAWIRNNTATVTGIAASGTGNITGALTNTTGASITVTFTITPTANGCPGTPITATVVVNTAATIVCPAPITVPSVVGGCTAVVTYTPTITGSPAPTLTYTFTGATTASGSGSGSGAAFNVGVTTVTITATNSCGTASCSFTVTVTDSQLPVISSQPANRTICTGLNATFSVTATNVVTYQWQQWNGTAWVNINGANASTFTLNGVTVSQNTNTYRVVLNGLCTIVNSNAATLFVNPPSTVTIAAAPPSILPNQTTTLTATGVPPGGTYAWTLNGTAVAGVTGAVLGPLNVNQLGTYRVVYTSPAGCISTSNDLTITGAASMELWVYPNPNTGQFQVRFYNMVNEAATVNVYDALGQKVYQRKLVTGNTAYTQIDIDLGFKANGIYIVELVNGSGKRIATKRINVQNK